MACLFSIISSSSLLLSVPWKGSASWLWHFLGIFTYTFGDLVIIGILLYDIYNIYHNIYHSNKAHNVETTSIQRWFNVKTLNQRWIDVVSTLCICWDYFLWIEISHLESNFHFEFTIKIFMLLDCKKCKKWARAQRLVFRIACDLRRRRLACEATYSKQNVCRPSKDSLDVWLPLGRNVMTPISLRVWEGRS